MWGPTSPHAPRSGHPLANGACAGRARAARVEFAGGTIDALALCEGAVLRTAEAEEPGFGVAQVRRKISSEHLTLVHIVFAPRVPRPILLGLVRLNNRSDEPVRVDYTELWDVSGTEYAAATGACFHFTSEGPRALSDLSYAVRGQPPEKPPRRGLALDVRLALPPRAHRQLCFGYAAPAPGEDPAWLLRAWRGDVAQELERTVQGFLSELEPGADPVAEYQTHAVKLSS